jgi:hypothetical protein
MLRLRLSGDGERQVQAASDRCGSRVLGAAEPACGRDQPRLPGRPKPLSDAASLICVSAGLLAFGTLDIFTAVGQAKPLILKPDSPEIPVRVGSRDAATLKIKRRT